MVWCKADCIYTVWMRLKSIQNHQSSTVCINHGLITEEESRICFTDCTVYICIAYKNKHFGRSQTSNFRCLHALYKHEWFWWSVLSEWLTIPIRRIIDKRSTLVGSARYLIRMSSEAPDCRCHSVSAI